MRKSNTVKPLGGKKIKLQSTLVIIAVFFLFSPLLSVFSESSLGSGEQLFLENKPAEAIPLLVKALEESPSNNRIYSYLGIAYEQTGQYEQAVEVYKKGLDYAGELESVFLTNIGNNYSLQGAYDSAIEYYSRAIALRYNGDALRNRAGEYLRKEMYDKALEDYKLYMTREISPYQSDRIKKVINLLENKLDLIARQKVEEERKRMEEDARQKELLSNVLNSLSTAGKDTTNLSGGTENADNYADDFDIVD